MTRRSMPLVAALVAGLVTLQGTAAAQVTAGQVDDFESPGVAGWIVGDPGHPAPPSNQTSGGPGGAGDGFLLLQSTGLDGPGSRMSAFNTAQWAGDYTAAGIAGVRLSANNFGPSALSLRLLLADPAGGPPSNAAVSTLALLLPANSGWTSLFFPLLPGSLTPVLGTVAGALSNATELRLFHNPAPVFTGPPNSSPAVLASLGIDNVTAVSTVPEPTTLGLLATGALALLVRRRRRRA